MNYVLWTETIILEWLVLVLFAVRRNRADTSSKANVFLGLADLSRAKRALVRRDYLAAKRLLDSCIRRVPDLGYAYYLRGHINVVLNENGDAITDLRTAISRDYDSEDTHFYLALALSNLGLVREAIEEYELTLKHEPNWAQAMVNLAHLKLWLNDEESAVPLLKRAVELEPAFCMAHQNIAALYDRSRYKPAALDRECRRELLLYDAYNFAGERAFHVGRGGEGIKIWTHALRIQQDLARDFRLPAEILQQVERLPGINPQLPYRILPYEWVTQIGHIAMLDTYCKIQALGWRPKANLLLLAPPKKVANLVYLDRWNRYFTIVSNEDLVNQLFPYQRYIGDCFNAFLLDDGNGVAWPDMGARAHIEWDKQKRAPLVSLPEPLIDRGREALASFGMPRDAWFVGLHAREGGYHHETISSTQGHRNVTISDYLPAINLIVEHGGWVVRMGDPTMTPLPEMEGVIDYAHTPAKSDWMDVFLCGASRFFVGTTSGLTNAVISFGSPCVLVNCLSNFSQLWNERVKFILKPFWSEREKRFLKLTEIVNEPVRSAIFNVRTLEEMGIETVNNSPGEIYSAIEETLLELDAGYAITNESAVEKAWIEAMNGNIIFGSARPVRKFLEQNHEIFF
ncbi:MAG: TIGR04372 family glycosyltransferase [Gammaproteobacteria bacterium]